MSTCRAPLGCLPRAIGHIGTKPRELFAVFQSYLFETQARFSGLAQAGSEPGRPGGLIGFLGVEETPTRRASCGHLLTCSEWRPGKSNREVYRFLNENADHQAVGGTQRESLACSCQTASMCGRDQVYWGSIPSGRFGISSGQSCGDMTHFFGAGGPRKPARPGLYPGVDRDGRAVRQGPPGHWTIDIYAVLMRCWKALSTALEEGRLEAKRPGQAEPMRGHPRSSTSADLARVHVL